MHTLLPEVNKVPILERANKNEFLKTIFAFNIIQHSETGENTRKCC